MKKLGIILALVALLAGFSDSAYAQLVNIMPSLPGYVDVNECIGGKECGGNDRAVIVLFPPGNLVRGIYVYADDNVGTLHQARLEVSVDDVVVGIQEVPSSSTLLYFPVNTVSYRGNIKLRSIIPGDYGNGDETRVHFVAVF